jgi:hypothetical protein
MEFVKILLSKNDEEVILNKSEIISVHRLSNAGKEGLYVFKTCLMDYDGFLVGNSGKKIICQKGLQKVMLFLNNSQTKRKKSYEL